MSDTRRILQILTALMIVGSCFGFGLANEPFGPAWIARDFRTSISLFPTLASSLELEIAVLPGEASQRSGVLSFVATSGSTLEFAAPGAAFAALLRGEVTHEGGFVVTWPGGSVTLSDFVLRAGAGPLTLELAGSDGMVYFELVQFEPHLDPKKGRLSLEKMDLRFARAMASKLGHPEYEGLTIGSAHLEASIEIPAIVDTARGACIDPDFSSDTDVALIEIGAVSQTARDPGGNVAITPSSTLQNVGDADVEWDPPFDGQHPYLAWSMYRMVDGAIEQIGRSGLKHAFFTINQDCGCPGGNVLWVGCSDVYSVANNESQYNLGPFDELEASTGLWEQCDSHFDGAPADCVRSHSNEHAEFDHRMLISEAELSTPAAKYFFESWYLVKDDIDIFNSMGYRQISPALVGSVWSFPFDTSLISGSVVDAWVDPANPPVGSANQTIDTGKGFVQLAVQTTDLGGGETRYEYVLRNHDFDHQIQGFSVPIADEVNISSTSFLDLDDDIENDWMVSRSAVALTWKAPKPVIRDELPNTIEWGALFRFTVIADTVPMQGTAAFESFEGGAKVFEIDTLGMLDRDVFADDFETGDTSRWDEP